MPAGLVDAGEEGKQGSTKAALRELHEETGYKEEDKGSLDVLETSEVMVNDPGMTGANMRLCIVKIEVADDAPEPVAQPEEGEFIEKHLVPLKGLYLSLQGKHLSAFLPLRSLTGTHGSGRVSTQRVCRRRSLGPLCSGLANGRGFGARWQKRFCRFVQKYSHSLICT